MIEGKIPKRVVNSLVTSLNSGTTPRLGLEYITVGRKKEITVLLNDLENAKNGGGSFKFIIGEYGSGKSFMLQAIRNKALDQDFVVMDVDLNPERRLCGTSGSKGLMTYRALMSSMTIKAKPSGGALESIIQRWINKLCKAVSDNEVDLLADRRVRSYLQQDLNKEIEKAVSNMSSVVYQYDFTKVMETYLEGYLFERDDLKKNALKWLSGGYDGKRDAYHDLKLNNFIGDANWFSFIKLWAEFVKSIGYSGLVVFFDEAKTLANISSSIGRNNNYEVLLSMFNDTVQGKAPHLAILMGGTDEFIMDSKRGLYSYAALRSRLDDGKYAEIHGKRNWDAPLMPLKVLTNEEIYALMLRLKDIHGYNYGYDPRVTEDDLKRLLDETVSRVGASVNLTAREVTRNTMNVLGALYHNPELTFDDIMKDGVAAPEDEEEDFLIDD